MYNRYIGIAFGLANVLTMVHTTDADLQAIRDKAQSITESIVGEVIIASKQSPTLSSKQF